MKVEVAILAGVPVSNTVVTVLMVAVDIKQHLKRKAPVPELRSCVKGGRPGLLVPRSQYGLCGHQATLNSNLLTQS